jgi:hypothetical protein
MWIKLNWLCYSQWWAGVPSFEIFWCFEGSELGLLSGIHALSYPHTTRACHFKYSSFFQFIVREILFSWFLGSFKVSSCDYRKSLFLSLMARSHSEFMWTTNLIGYGRLSLLKPLLTQDNTNRKKPYIHATSEIRSQGPSVLLGEDIFPSDGAATAMYYSKSVPWQS